MRLSYGTHQKSWLKADARAELNGARRPRARNHPKISGAECEPGDVEVRAVQQVVRLGPQLERHAVAKRGAFLEREIR